MKTTSRTIASTIFSFWMVAGILAPSNASAANESIAAVQNGTGSFIPCPTGCSGPQTGVTCPPGSLLFTFDLVYQLIENVCGGDNPPCGATFTAVSEFCAENFAANGAITSVVSHGIGIARCLKGGVPTQLGSAAGVAHSRFQNDTTPAHGEVSFSPLSNSPVTCDGFGKVNMAQLGHTIEHFTHWNPTTATSGGAAASFVR